MLRHFIHRVIHRIVFVGLWRIRVERQFSQVILCFMEVSLWTVGANETGSRWLECIPSWSKLGCGRFFEGTAEEMHTALNKTLAAVPDDTVVYVSLLSCSHHLKVAIKYSPFDLAWPRIHKSQCQIRRLGFPEWSRQGPRSFRRQE